MNDGAHGSYRTLTGNALPVTYLLPSILFFNRLLENGDAMWPFVGLHGSNDFQLRKVHNRDCPIGRRPRRELRWLGTNAAVQLMFDRARNDSSQLDTLALLGAPDRAQVVAQFDRYLADPEVGFREWDIRVRALFTVLENSHKSLFSIKCYWWVY